MAPRDRSMTYNASGAPWRVTAIERRRALPSAALSDLLGLLILLLLLGMYLVAG